ncbi:MAG: aconitate hydratase AcnA [Candidatus Nanopelagicales bacterium]
MSINSFDALVNLDFNSRTCQMYDINKVSGSKSLPFSLKILLENLLRTEDGINVTKDHINAIANWDENAEPSIEIPYTPARVIMQDFTGVPAIVDLATMREAMIELGGNPEKVNPLAPAELVIDHSVIADSFGSNMSFQINVDLEYERNEERYQFLRWGQGAFSEFKVVPPGTGIVHQVNIENLARVVFEKDSLVYPDTVVGTDSHTTMVNGLGVLGWGVGGIEAEAAMLGQPVSMLIPKVVGFKLTGSLKEGVTATDLVLTITEILRKHGVVGKFVEFYGAGCSSVPLANRATIGNMSPEYGSTVAIFPIDEQTIEYLKFTGRSKDQLALVESYAKKQGLWLDPNHEPRFSEHLQLDLSTIEPSIAGPKRPQDRVSLKNAKENFNKVLPNYTNERDKKIEVNLDGEKFDLTHGAVVIAAITSCTNTSNPEVMIGAGLVAKKAVEAGLTRSTWVKTTLAPGSQVVTDYLNKSGLTPYLSKLGFDLVGYGCTTCIGNSGPLPEAISNAINKADLAAVSVLSGNRNFEGRINPDVKMNYLASPPLVVAYAIAGTMNIDLINDPIGLNQDGKKIYLKDIWPSTKEIQDCINQAIDSEMFVKRYADVFKGDDRWQKLPTPTGKTFTWSNSSTYVRKPPYFENMPKSPQKVTDISNARALAWLGDSVTTDHISPAGSIKLDSPAGKYLIEHGIDKKDFNSYGSRRGNHEVMIRGTFANIRLKNKLLKDVEGGFTFNFLKDKQDTIYDASVDYINNNIPLIILAGKEYGSGSSRDWAAKGTALLGVKAVIAESYERIHRSNLVGMGVLPLQFVDGQNVESLGLDGSESFSISGIEKLNENLIPQTLEVTAQGKNGDKNFQVKLRIDTPGEADYYRNGGILPFVLRQLAK